LQKDDVPEIVIRAMRMVVGGILGGIGAAAGAAIPIGNPLYEAPGGLKKSGP